MNLNTTKIAVIGLVKKGSVPFFSFLFLLFLPGITGQDGCYLAATDGYNVNVNVE